MCKVFLVLHFLTDLASKYFYLRFCCRCFNFTSYFLGSITSFVLLRYFYTRFIIVFFSLFLPPLPF